MGIRYTSDKLFDIRAVMARSQTGLGPATGYPVSAMWLIFGQFMFIRSSFGLSLSGFLR